MKSFQHLAPPMRLYYGSDSIAMLGRELERSGSKRAVIFCGRSLSSQPGALGLVQQALGDRCTGVFDRVQSHSPVPVVQEAARELVRLQADAAVALGGGSAIVTARAASILAAEGPDPRLLCTRRGPDGRMISPRLQAPKIPQFVLPTTPTTACVKAGSAVFEPGSGERLALYDPKTRAQAVFVHPQLLATAPDELVLSASLNTLAMAVEGLESSLGHPMSDAYLMHVLRLLSRHLPLADGDTSTARGELVLAAILCGQGTEVGAGGLASVLGHAIGARHHIDNGLANAIVLPHTMRFNAPATVERSGQISAALSRSAVGGSEGAIAAVEELLGRLLIPRRLRDVGVPQEGLTSIADHSLTDWFLQKNPRRVRDSEELKALLSLAW